MDPIERRSRQCSSLENFRPWKIKQISVSYTTDTGATKIGPSVSLISETAVFTDQVIQIADRDLFVLIELVVHAVKNFDSFGSGGNNDLVKVVLRSSVSAQLRALVTPSADSVVSHMTKSTPARSMSVSSSGRTNLTVELSLDPHR